jgi:hypothetical protein
VSSCFHQRRQKHLLDALPLADSSLKQERSFILALEREAFSVIVVAMEEWRSFLRSCVDYHLVERCFFLCNRTVGFYVGIGTPELFEQLRLISQIKRHTVM